MTASPANTSLTTILIIEVKKLTSQLLDTIKTMEAKSHCPMKIIPVCEPDNEKSNANIDFIVNSLKKQSDVRVIHLGKMCSHDKDFDTMEMLRNKVALADLQIGELTGEVDSLLNDINAITSSTSWRITIPIRKIKAMGQTFLRVFRYRRHLMAQTTVTENQLLDNGIFQPSENFPQITLASSQNTLPVGWVKISAKISVELSVCAELYIADENGFSSDNSEILEINNNRVHQLIRLPARVQGLKLFFLGDKAQFKIGRFNITEVGSAQVFMTLLWQSVSKRWLNPAHLIKQLHKGIGFYRTNGASATVQRLIKSGRSTDYQKWIQAYSTITMKDREQISAHIEKMTYKPLISILLPVYNPPERLLMAAIESVQNQIYDNWELCIADDASTLPYIRTVLETCKINDSRIKLIFREKNGHISACSNSALSLVTGEFTALLDHDDKLAPHALYMVAQELNQFPDADILYSDEDKIDQDGQRVSPHFKPDWNPELFFSINYLSHLGVYRTRLIHSVNGFREGIEGSQDYDLVLRCIQQTTPSKIRHIPHVLYHWRASEGSTALNNQEKSYATNAGVQALKNYFSEIDPGVKVTASQSPTTYRVHYPLESEPRVCLIIPTKNNHKLLKTCLDSIIEKTNYYNYKIVIVNNQSDNPDTLAYLRSLEQKPKCRVISYDHAFNYSAINNFAVGNTKSELVALLNDDVEVISPEWLREMVSYAIQPDVGAVGAKLLYPDNRVQHAGVILGLGGVAGHAHKYMVGTGNGHGYFHRLLLPQAVSAVTGACLLVRRQVYEQVGGLDHLKLAVAFNDVDFCLRITKAGYRNVWTPYALLYHHESVSRGYEDTREKQERFNKEVAYMKKKWGVSLKKDPYYNPNLSMASENFSLGFPSRAKKPWQAYAVDVNLSMHT